jgi:hypothetical protein
MQRPSVEIAGECRGCHHDVQLARHEFFLHLPPSFGIQSGMVYGYGKLACPLFRQGVSLGRAGINPVGGL